LRSGLRVRVARLGARLLGFREVGARHQSTSKKKPPFFEPGGGALTPISSAQFRGSAVGLASLCERFGLGDDHELCFAAPVAYRTTLAYLDAKEWGVPQTRARKYMLLWKEGSFGEGVEVARRWHELCTHLRPLKYNVDSFLLADENDAPPLPSTSPSPPPPLSSALGQRRPLRRRPPRLLPPPPPRLPLLPARTARCPVAALTPRPLPPQRVHRFRDALRGPLGRLTAVSRQGGDWWGEQANKDTQANKDFRACRGGKVGQFLKTPLAELSRPYTNWGGQGQASLASHTWWSELVSVLSQRQLDMIDCFGVKAAELGLDPLHHSLWWNISQNVGRTENIPLPGITGCITPGGEHFGPHKGRSILGYEKLLLSGIPADKLLLGTESEVQLSDLAGNAMVMPVVSAAILAVLCLPAYARKLAEDAKFSLASLASHEAGGGARGGAATFSEGQRVELRCGERWEPANIADVNEDGTYDVALAAGAADAGKMFGGVGAAHVRRRASEGRVEAASAIQRCGAGCSTRRRRSRRGSERCAPSPTRFTRARTGQRWSCLRPRAPRLTPPPPRCAASAVPSSSATRLTRAAPTPSTVSRGPICATTRARRACFSCPSTTPRRSTCSTSRTTSSSTRLSGATTRTACTPRRTSSRPSAG